MQYEQESVLLLQAVTILTDIENISLIQLSVLFHLRHHSYV